jgi:hypothetical protein
VTDPRAPGGHIDERAVVWDAGRAETTKGAATKPDWRRAVRVYDDEERDERATRVSLAVDLVDAFTGKRPRGEPRVSIVGHSADPVLNASGYHVFVDLNLTGDVTVTVDGGAYYADPEDTTVTIPAEPTGTAGEDVFDRSTDPIELVPTPTYPFPPGTTLVRGRVIDDRGATPSRISGAQVQVDGIDRTTTTTSEGEYVLCFARADAVSVVRDGAEWFIHVGDMDPTITVDVDGLGTHSVSEPVRVGRTTLVDLTYD